MPLLSIVTVVYNDKLKIENTINSVLNQDFKDIEYIIIDGDSTDGTQEIIESKINNFKEFKIIYLSEKDEGLYFAMNKAIDLASSSFIMFLNSGDEIFAKNTLIKLFNLNLYGDVIYGKTEIKYDEENKKILEISNHNHKFHHKFVHQSSITKLKIMKEFHFETKFKIASDTNFFTTLFNSGFEFQFVDLIIASFDANGISSTISYAVFKEELKIGQKYSKLFFVQHFATYLFNLVPRYFVKKLIPKNNLNKLRKILSQKSI